jgi:hypothetical protein
VSPNTTAAGLGGDRLANAATIVAVGKQLGVPEQGQVVAITAAITESGLENLDHGDRDSLGLLQQRPSQGWGNPTQILNPSYTIAQFYRHLHAVPGWQQMSVNDAAQARRTIRTPHRLRTTRANRTPDRRRRPKLHMQRQHQHRWRFRGLRPHVGAQPPQHWRRSTTPAANADAPSSGAATARPPGKRASTAPASSKPPMSPPEFRCHAWRRPNTTRDHPCPPEQRCNLATSCSSEPAPATSRTSVSQSRPHRCSTHPTRARSSASTRSCTTSSARRAPAPHLKGLGVPTGFPVAAHVWGCRMRRGKRPLPAARAGRVLPRLVARRDRTGPCPAGSPG